eukprot:scaffold164_cov409-Prasinococcus_capsulatus_cf.AAC.10
MFAPSYLGGVVFTPPGSTGSSSMSDSVQRQRAPLSTPSVSTQSGGGAHRYPLSPPPPLYLYPDKGRRSASRRPMALGAHRRLSWDRG